MTIVQRSSLSRALLQDVSVRGSAAGRTVFGITVPYDVEAKVNDGYGPYTEVFRRGAFAKTISESGSRIKLCVNHDKLRRLPIGRATLLREDAAGLYGEFNISKTQEGDEALTLIRDGVVDAFSVGFVPMKEREAKRGVVERLEVKMSEVSVVAFPAYVDALIGGLRHDYAIPVEEYERLVEIIRTHPELLELLNRDAVVASTTPATTADLPADTTVDDSPAVPDEADTPEGAVDTEPAASDEDQTTRADTSDYQPARPVPVTFDRRKADRESVQHLLARLDKRSA